MDLSETQPKCSFYLGTLSPKPLEFIGARMAGLRGGLRRPVIPASESALRVASLRSLVFRAGEAGIDRAERCEKSQIKEACWTQHR